MKQTISSMMHILVGIHQTLLMPKSWTTFAGTSKPPYAKHFWSWWWEWSPW
jgi:hypothetical protein